MAWNSRPIAVFVASKTNGVTYSDWFSAFAEVMYPKWICFLFNEPEKETNLRQVWNIQYSHNFFIKYIRLSLPELVIFVIRAFQMRNTKLYISNYHHTIESIKEDAYYHQISSVLIFCLQRASIHALHFTSLHSTPLHSTPLYTLVCCTILPYRNKHLRVNHSIVCYALLSAA